MKALALLLLCGTAMAADPSVNSTRVGPFDFQAQRSDGTTSNHQRSEIAGFACANWLFQNPTGTCAVQGGKWNITVTTVINPPEVASAVLSWPAATQYTDSTPIVGPVEYKLYSGAPGAAKTVLATVTTTSYTDKPVGAKCYELAVLNGGAESAKSNEVCKS